MYSCHLFIFSASVDSYHFCILLCPSLHGMFSWCLSFSRRDLWSFSFYYFPLYLCTVHLTRPSYLFLIVYVTLHSVGYLSFIAIQFNSVAQLCPTLCNPMECSMPGLPVHHQLPEFMQTHVHHVSDIIQLSHPLLSLSLPAFNLSQHQGLFQWVSSSH